MHKLGLKVNSWVIIHHEQVKECKAILQANPVIRAVGSKPVNRQGTAHWHRFGLRVKTQAPLVSCPNPFRVTRLIHKQAWLLRPTGSYLGSYPQRVRPLTRKTYLRGHQSCPCRRSLEFQYHIYIFRCPIRGQNRPFPFLVVDP